MNFSDARNKLQRARHHYEVLQREVRVSLTAYEPSLEARPGPQPGQVAIFATRDVSVPTTDWALIVGDCVHDARAALDYAAWQAAGVDPEDRDTSFPIACAAAEWRSVKSSAQKLPKAFGRLVTIAQPCFARSAQDTPLRVLRVLNNADKHRLLQVVVAAVGRVSLTWSQGPDQTPTGRMTVEAADPDAPILAGSCISIVTIEGLEATHSPKPELGLELMFGPTVGIGRRVDVLKALDAILIDVQTILDRFERQHLIETIPPPTTVTP